MSPVEHRHGVERELATFGSQTDAIDDKTQDFYHYHCYCCCGYCYCNSCKQTIEQHNDKTKELHPSELLAP